MGKKGNSKVWLHRVEYVILEATVIRKSRVSPRILTGTAEWTVMDFTDIETV